MHNLKTICGHKNDVTSRHLHRSPVAFRSCDYVIDKYDNIFHKRLWYQLSFMSDNQIIDNQIKFIEGSGLKKNDRNILKFAFNVHVYVFHCWLGEIF